MIDSKFCKIMNALWIIPLPQNLTENALKIGHPFPKGKDRCQITREQSYVWQKSPRNSSFSNWTFARRGYVKLPRVTHCFQNTWNLDISSPEQWKKSDCLGYIRDYTTQYMEDFLINYEIFGSRNLNQPGWLMESMRGLFSWLTCCFQPVCGGCHPFLGGNHVDSFEVWR